MGAAEDAGAAGGRALLGADVGEEVRAGGLLRPRSLRLEQRAASREEGGGGGGEGGTEGGPEGRAGEGGPD